LKLRQGCLSFGDFAIDAINALDIPQAFRAGALRSEVGNFGLSHSNEVCDFH